MSRSRTYRPRLEGLEDRLAPAVFTVKNLNDAGIGSLRQAILNANATTAADTIVFKAGLEGTIRLTSGEIDITSNLSVVGPGASKIAVSGNFSSRIFNIVDPTEIAELTVKLSGLELRHGQAPGNGGAILATEKLTLSKMVVAFNQAGGSGGAIACTQNLKVVNSTISGNTAGLEGGGIRANATATITGSTIAGNTAGDLGGGIRCVTTATMTNCKIFDNTSATFGGGIICSVLATITGCTISGNKANNGGGVSGGMTITDSTITANTATASGGGFFGTTAMITDCTVSGNTASAGGGISCFLTGTITDSTIFGNSAVVNGGGIDCSTATITRSKITSNTAGTSGGGIDCNSATISRSTLSGNRATSGGGIRCRESATITASTISGNTANKGGGAYLQTANPVTFRNSTISGNRATGGGIGSNYGGGIYSQDSTVDIQNCTIAFNQAGALGGGISSTGASSITLTSTIVALNIALGNVDLDSNTTNFLADHSLIGNRDGADTVVNVGGTSQLGSTGSEIDPLLAPLANNGGPTQTHKLKKGSPAINAGTNPAPPELFDQRGPGFKRKLGPAVDIGAFERQ